MRTIGSELASRFGGLALATVSRAWMSSLDYQTIYFDESVDPAVDRSGTFSPRIYVFWHEYIPYQFYLRGNCNVAMLLSRNRDAEWLSRAARHMGFETIRGSTYRGGRAALRQLVRKSRNSHLTMTPDGPRGPRRTMSQGPVYLSSKLGIPIVAIGMGYDRPWRLDTWDRFAVPRPSTRARAVFGPPMTIPPDLSRGAMEDHRKRVETVLNRLTEQAEQWAESGKRDANQRPTSRLPARVRSYRFHRNHELRSPRSWR